MGKRVEVLTDDGPVNACKAVGVKASSQGRVGERWLAVWGILQVR